MVKLQKKDYVPIQLSNGKKESATSVDWTQGLQIFSLTLSQLS